MNSKSIIKNIFRIYLFIKGHDLFIKPDIHIDYDFFGSEYGGWPVLSSFVNTNSIVYSAGIGDDVTFDIGLIERFGVTIHAFDPTPSAIEYINKNIHTRNFVMHSYGFYNKDQKVNFHQPKNENYVSYSIFDKGSENIIVVEMKRLKTTMDELGHDHIDILKIDIEGAEYDFVKDMLRSNIYPIQLLIEFHHRFKKIKTKMTKEVLQLLKEKGYSLFYVSNEGTDYGFVRNDIL